VAAAAGLIGAAVAALAARGHGRMFLAVHADSPAREFYTRLGFTPG